MSMPGALPQSRSRVNDWLCLLGIVSVFTFGQAMTAPTVLHHDLWHQMALARKALSTGQVPLRDSFAYTPTLNPVVHHEWGAGVIGLAVTRLGGGPGLVAWNELVLAALTTFLVLRLRADGVPWLIGLLAAAFPIAAGILSFPPVVAQIYSILFCAVLLLWLKKDEQGLRGWILPWLAICLLWANLHGGMIIGIAIVSAYGVEAALRGKPWRHLLLVLAGMLAAMAFTPFGISYYRYIARALTMPRPIISEWNPAWLFAKFGLQQFLFLASALVAAIVFWRCGWKACHGIVIVAVLAIASARSEKVMTFYALVWLVTIPRSICTGRLAEAAERLVREESVPLGIVFSVLMLVSAWGLWHRGFWDLNISGASRSGPGTICYPVGPVQYIASHDFQGNVLTDFQDGAYVSWKLAPKVKVGCDSRYEAAYPAEFVERVVRMFSAGDLKSLDDITRSYPTDLVLSRSAQPLTAKLETAAVWSKVYEDDVYVLFARPGLKLPYEERTGERITGSIP